MNKAIKWTLGGIGAFLLLLIIIGLSGGDSDTNTSSQERVLNLSGTNAQKSDEFSVGSTSIKFVYTCDEGTFVCTARLRQVGGEISEEIFRSSGNSGSVSAEKTIETGPGRFYVEVDTQDRLYSIEAYEVGEIAADTAQETAVQQIAESESCSGALKASSTSKTKN